MGNPKIKPIVNKVEMKKILKLSFEQQMIEVNKMDYLQKKVAYKIINKKLENKLNIQDRVLISCIVLIVVGWIIYYVYNY